MRWVCIAFVFCSVLSGFSHAQDDYLSSELRTSVEQLKADVGAGRSSNDTARQRARVLWEWVNAFAMTGRYIPVNATQVVNSVMSVLPEDAVPPGLLRGLDALVHEFSLRDEQPAALGAVSIAPAGPFRIQSWQTIEVTYTVGEKPMLEGGTLLIARHFFSDAGRWQYDRAGADNFVSIRCSNEDATFEKTKVAVRGMHGGFRAAAQQLAFRLEATILERGDTITVVYGDKSGGSRGLEMQSFSNDAVALPLYIDLDGNDVFLSLPIATYSVVGKETHAVHGFAPSVVTPGETFELSVRAEDEFYNRATGSIPEIEVLLNGRAFRTLPAGDNALQLLSDISLDSPGVYRFSFRSPDGAIEGYTNPIWVTENPPWRLYWGETHGHCGFAEGLGSADGYFTFGRDDARLDFLTLSEHDIWLDDYEWKFLNEAVEKYSEEGKFIVYPGYEWTSRRDRGGHHNVFFRRAGLERVPVQEAPRLTQLYLGLHAKHDPKDVLVIPHAHQAGDWRTSDVYLEKLVEIMSMHGTFEWFGDRYLAQGHEVGFISASDDHLDHPGYSGGTGIAMKQRGGLAAVFAQELSTDSVFDALRDRAAYATSGERIILDVRLNGARMGTRQAYSEKRFVEGRVMGTAPIDSVELIKNGETIRRKEFLTADLSSHVFVQVNFDSDSTAFVRDNPRGYRPWRGSLEVSGADLVGIETPGFHEARYEWAIRDEGNENRINFSTLTRGRINNLVLELDGANGDTIVRIVLEQGRESGTAPIRIRQFARIPSADVAFRFGDFEDGASTHAFQVGRYVDNLTLRFIDPKSPLDREFGFSDDEEPGYGDYYYVRVRQMDGALAWSSPFWVGGESPR